MKTLFLLFAVGFLCFSSKPKKTQKIFDVHIYGSNNVATQLKALEQAGVWKAAISTSWDLQNTYREKSKVNLLFGLMLPCPNGKVPYGLQECYEDGQDWPFTGMVRNTDKGREN